MYLAAPASGENGQVHRKSMKESTLHQANHKLFRSTMPTMMIMNGEFAVKFAESGGSRIFKRFPAGVPLLASGTVRILMCGPLHSNMSTPSASQIVCRLEL